MYVENSMHHSLSYLAAWLLTNLLVPIALAAPALPSPHCTDIRPALQAAASILKQRYVIPVMAQRGAASIVQATRRKSDFEVCGEVDAQANRLTQLLRDALPDWHIRVAAGSPPAKHPMVDAEPAAGAKPDDHGIAEVSRLADGVGYLRITQFDEVSVTAPRLAHAMALLADVQGLIIDVRGNPGGDSNTVDLIVRSMLPANAPATLIKLDRNAKNVPGVVLEPSWARFPATTKVSVLIDRGSASAAEGLAFALREEGRATIVGARSLGASHIVDDIASLPGGFSLSIPEFRVAGRKSGQDWERVGVVPDIAASGPDAVMFAWQRVREDTKP
jgi:carboxyl-terminal processing protease